MLETEETSRILGLVKKFVEDAEGRYPIVEAYLFGSWAYGTPREDSDIDVGLVWDKDASFEQEVQLRLDAQIFSNKIETVVFEKQYFDTARSSIINDIKEKGIRIA
jgi:predicted nucleotidyltransferase